MNSNIKYSQNIGSSLNGLHLAAYFGLRSSVESTPRVAFPQSHKRDKAEADVRDENDWTPLSWAAYRGHGAVVELLVERDDVEADSKDENGLTPLSQAVE